MSVNCIHLSPDSDYKLQTLANTLINCRNPWMQRISWQAEEPSVPQEGMLHVVN
jgi:hypothetical protein